MTLRVESAAGSCSPGLSGSGRLKLLCSSPRRAEVLEAAPRGEGSRAGHGLGGRGAAEDLSCRPRGAETCHFPRTGCVAGVLLE